MEQTKHFTKATHALKDLPVASVLADVLQSVGDKKVTILTAETGSGKTLLANAALADASDHPIWVLVPRRFLAINAAETVASLSGCALGNEVGYAIGQKATGRSKYGANSKLIFATYGYALSSGLLDDPKTKTIVCDEVHEKGIDTSLARAIIHRRLKEKGDLRVMEMSATIDADRQADYWKDVAQTAIHHAEGKSFDCEFRHQTDEQKSFLLAMRDLLQEVERTDYKNVAADNQQKGIAVFIEGVKEAENWAAQLRDLCKESKMPNVEVATIYSDMDDVQRKAALAAPKPGNLKVLIGTPVIESGMNIPWLRAGISNGLAKVPYYNYFNGAESLRKENLPQWRITQQEGRVKRFDKGIFVLHSQVPKEDREMENSPEIERISMNGLVMYAANYGLDPTALKFDADVPVAKLEEAKLNLQRLQLLNDDWTLTQKGRFIMGLPLLPEAGSMLWAAQEKYPAIMNDAIELAAIAEVGNMVPVAPQLNAAEEVAHEEEAKSRRKFKGKSADKKSGDMRADMKIGHGEDMTSDVFDALKAYKKVAATVVSGMEQWCVLEGVAIDDYRSLSKMGREPGEEECNDKGMSLRTFRKLFETERKLVEDSCAQKNMSVMRYKEARELIADLHRRLDDTIAAGQKPASTEQMVQLLLHGYVNHVFEKTVGKVKAGGKEEGFNAYNDLTRSVGGHKEDKYSVAASGRSDENFAISTLREVVSATTGQSTVYAGCLTRVSKEALLDFLADNPGILTDKKLVTNAQGKTDLTGKYFGNTDISLRIPKHPKPKILSFLGAPDVNLHTKPVGANNSHAVDDTPKNHEVDSHKRFKRVVALVAHGMKEWCDTYRIDYANYVELSKLVHEPGEDEFEKAAIAPDVFNELKLKEENLVTIYCGEKNLDVRFYNKLRSAADTFELPAYAAMG